VGACSSCCWSSSPYPHAHPRACTSTAHTLISRTDTQLTARLNYKHNVEQRRQTPAAVAASEVQTAATAQAAAAAHAAREAWEDERERLVSELDVVRTASSGLWFSLPAHASCDEQTQ
jgi:hypothetical protein